MPNEPADQPIYSTKRCEEYGRQVAINLAKGFIDQAHRVIDQFARNETKTEPGEVSATLAMSVAQTAISPRTINKLEAFGLFTLGDIVTAKRWEVMDIPQLGVGSVVTIQKVLTSLGLTEIPQAHESWRDPLPQPGTIDRMKRESSSRSTKKH